MRALRVTVLVIVVLSLGATQRSLADPEECQEAVSEYKSAMDDISTALVAYTSCVSSSRGHDDCSSEFQTLRSAQDDFEDAVSKYESECN
jgi:hypothetical protein